MRYYPHKLLYFNNETFRAGNLLEEVCHWVGGLWESLAWESISLGEGFESLQLEEVYYWGGALRISNLRKCVMGGGEEGFWESLGWVRVSLGEDFESLPPCPTSRLLSGLSLWCCLLGFLLLMCTLLPSLPLLAFPSVLRSQNNLFTL